MCLNDIQVLNQHNARGGGYDHDFIERLDSLLWAILRSRRASFSLRSDGTLTPSTETNWPRFGCEYSSGYLKDSSVSAVSPQTNNTGSRSDLGHPGITPADFCNSQERDYISSNFSDLYCSAASRSSPSPRTPRSQWSVSDSSRSSPQADGPLTSNPSDFQGDSPMTNIPSLREDPYLSPGKHNWFQDTSGFKPDKDSILPHISTTPSSTGYDKICVWKLGDFPRTKRARSLIDVEKSGIASDHAVSCLLQPPKKKRKNASLRPSLSLPFGHKSNKAAFTRGPASLRRALSLRSDFSSSISANKVCV